MTKELEPYVGIEVVCKFTGLPKDTVYEKSNPNKTPKDALMPSYKAGKEKRFLLSEIDQWMKKFKSRAS